MLAELKQRNNETAFEYKVRICLMKLNKEISLDWCEIVELLGLECSSDHLRKLAYAYKEYHDYMQEHPNTDSTEEHIAKINEKIRELEITKIQVADEKRMYKQVLREEARRRAILDTILNKIEELNNCKPMINKNIVHINSDKVMCVLLSDLHYGAAFDTFLNSYNSEIAKERINKYKDAIINLYNTNSPKVINIELLGDLIENALHVTARLDTDKDIGRQIIEASELISEFIFEIAEHTKVPIKIYMVEGNHDRITIKKEEALTGESFTGVMKEIIKLRLSRVNNVSFINPFYTDDICVMEVFDRHIGLIHGHNDKKQSARKILNEFLEGYDYLNGIHCGHWHNVEITREGVIVNGSVKGSDRYAQNLRYSSAPQQVVVIYDRAGNEQINRIVLK